MTTPLAKDNVMLRNIRPALKTIHFEWVDFHVLRRTHSSLMRELGVDPKLVADQSRRFGKEHRGRDALKGAMHAETVPAGFGNKI